jgi:TRAP-type transport system periplasmic protein
MSWEEFHVHRARRQALRACGCAGATAAQAQTIELKLSHFVPPNHAFHKWATAWAEQLGKIPAGA